MIQDYEENIIAPPLEFRDKHEPRIKSKKLIPAPRPIGAMLKVEKPIPKPRIKSKIPIPAPRTRITPVKRVLKDAVETYEINLKNKSDPLI